MLGFYDYTVILTYLGLASSIFGIIQALEGHLLIAIVCLMVSGCCDMFDGKVARTKKDRTEDGMQFGIQIDSLCDMVCYGIFPVVIGYAVGIRRPMGIAFMVIYALAALIRLAFFNVMETHRQEETDECRKYYQGLPVTTVAIIFPIVFLMRGILKSKFLLIYEIVMIIVAFLFVLDFKVKKANKKGMIAMIILGVLIVARLVTVGVV